MRHYDQIMIDSKPAKAESGSQPLSCRKPYHSPHLMKFGDVRSITLGGSDVVSDSGSSLRRSN